MPYQQTHSQLSKTELLAVDPGSFRDRQGRVYSAEGRTCRGLSARALEAWKVLETSQLFQKFTAKGNLVATRRIQNHSVPELAAEGWAAVLEHETIPFISYPSEWCFGMLRDAALLHLEFLDAAFREEMILQDATAFNVQWRGSQPVFIDVPSFVPLTPRQPWVAYRQFCEQFLYPLMLQAYKGVAFQPWLRGSLEGISAEQVQRLLSWRDRLRPGVLLHVCLQARLQARYAGTTRVIKRELHDAGFSKEMIQANLRGLRRLVSGLSCRSGATGWLHYERNASYDRQDRERKERFVRRVVQSRRWGLVWDLGCNTGRFSRLAAQSADFVVALDADHETIERLYQQLKSEGCRSILPLVADVADPSPNRGWRGLERKALPERGRPDLILCLALLHHLVVDNGIPLREVVDWLATLCQHLVIEFVTRDDPMVQTLLRHKDEPYADYSLPFFEQCLDERFDVMGREVLASGTRILYHGQARPYRSGQF
jgi:SAM-dependent methyltransferase